MKKLFMVLLLCISMFGFFGQEARAQDDVKLSNDASDFVLLTDVVPDAILEIRYFSTYNFVGDRIDGYHQPTALLTKEAARALKAVSDDVMKKGYRLKIYDALPSPDGGFPFRPLGQRCERYPHETLFLSGTDKRCVVPPGLYNGAFRPQPG